MTKGEADRVSSLTRAIREGDLPALAEVLSTFPTLAGERFGNNEESWTALHIATDWPGHFPRVDETIALLVSSGAPIDGRFMGRHRETPLHWAASSDDVIALDALLDAGAAIDADGAVLTGGTPLSDAVVFAQWNAARRLVERGARMTIWQAAALGNVTEVERHLRGPATTDQDITNACWHACRVGCLPATQLLASRGADLDWVGHDGQTPRQMGLASGSDELLAWLLTH